MNKIIRIVPVEIEKKIQINDTIHITWKKYSFHVTMNNDKVNENSKEENESYENELIIMVYRNRKRKY